MLQLSRAKPGNPASIPYSEHEQDDSPSNTDTSVLRSDLPSPVNDRNGEVVSHYGLRKCSMSEMGFQKKKFG